MPERPAYIDESFQEHDSEGFYVLAATVLGHGAAEIGTLLKGLAAHRSPGKLHWAKSSPRYRRAATERIAGLDAFHVVAVGAPVAPRKQERARAICLRRLAFELNGLGVTQLFMESRQRVLDRRDVQIVQQARFDLPKEPACTSSTAGGHSSRGCGWPMLLPASCVLTARETRPTWSC